MTGTAAAATTSAALLVVELAKTQAVTGAVLAVLDSDDELLEVPKKDVAVYTGKAVVAMVADKCETIRPNVKSEGTERMGSRLGRRCR